MNDNSMLYLVLLGFASGFINMFAGGGSMLVVPFLIFLGLPPHVANATNRVAILLQNIVSTATFRQKKILNFKTDYPLLLPHYLGKYFRSFYGCRHPGCRFTKNDRGIIGGDVFYDFAGSQYLGEI